MRKLAVVAVILVSFSLFSFAQSSAPKIELFGGYSFARADLSDLSISDFNTHGWNAEVAFNYNRFLGLVADVDGHYRNESFSSLGGVGIPGSVNLKVHDFLFGPQLSLRTPKVTPFARVLFGVARSTGDVRIPIVGSVLSVSDTAFSMAVGGGMDVNLTDNFGVRLAQIDYLRTGFFSDRQNNYRISTGLVVRF